MQKGDNNMKKLLERVKKEFRKIRFQIWKRKFKEDNSFEVEEDNEKFIISLNFSRKTNNIVKEDISDFLQICLKKENIDIVTTLEITKRIYSIGCSAEGIEGRKILLFFGEFKP